MGLHLEVGVRLADHDDVVAIARLPRVTRGLTNSAMIAVGDRIDFDGVQFVVERIIHQHISHHNDRAPNSVIHGHFTYPITDKEVQILKIHGFEFPQ